MNKQTTKIKKASDFLQEGLILQYGEAFCLTENRSPWKLRFLKIENKRVSWVLELAITHDKLGAKQIIECCELAEIKDIPVAIKKVIEGKA